MYLYSKKIRSSNLSGIEEVVGTVLIKNGIRYLKSFDNRLYKIVELSNSYTEGDMVSIPLEFLQEIHFSVHDMVRENRMSLEAIADYYSTSETGTDTVESQTPIQTSPIEAIAPVTPAIQSSPVTVASQTTVPVQQTVAPTVKQTRAIRSVAISKKSSKQLGDIQTTIETQIQTNPERSLIIAGVGAGLLIAFILGVFK